KEKYNTKENLLSAWGSDMLGNFKAEGFPIESWEENQIYPVGNPWFYSPIQLEGSQQKRKARLLDTIEFLTELQDSVYKKMSDAIRKTGYKGILLSSNWQAGSGTSHYMNLYSDSKIGIIDRHNYFGSWNENIIYNSSMLSVPGSAILSTGFQQVYNRPFMISEWIHVIPNEWGVEGPAIIGAYGMGLQGWDVSFMFQNTDPGEFLKAIQSSRYNCWHIAIPQILGSFPTVSRMVIRRDIKESEKTYTLYVYLPDMLKGKWDFQDTMRQEYDVKSFSTNIAPTEALAVSRIAVNFVDKPQTNLPFNFDKFKTEDGAYISDTGELLWKPGKKASDGFFCIKTQGTEALVGFAKEQKFSGNFADVTSFSQFASIFLTAKDKDKTLFNDNYILISCIARARNSGALYLFDRIIANFGHKDGPILLEPVKAEIKLKRPGNPVVYILDHDGINTGKTIPLSNGILKIDGSRDKTPYYLIEYK
ncbi:MAG TPA: hypothetical protein P5239_06720, partial [Victivallales bacterium]|nr:hypothetical protein [Victivallales bacterium]